MAAPGKVYVYPNGATMLPYDPPSAGGYYIGRTSLTMPSYTTIPVYNESTDTLLGTFSFSYSGYTFKEWNTSPDGTGTSYNAGDSVTGTGTKNFYAIWEAEAVDVAISYKGSSIATMSASGTKTLETEGKYCEDDITVTYTKPAAPTPTLQTKSATYTPSTSQQTASITADAGYDGLDEVNVTVNAMPSGSASTPATTITANPTISVSSGGLITASVSGSQSVTPTVSAGYVSSGTAGTVSVSGSNTSQLSVYAGAHHYLAPPAYTVTISLTNPYSPGYFSSCSIYEYTNNTKGDLIGSIDSPTGNTELSLATNIGAIRIEFRGGYISIDADPVCTGDIYDTDRLSSGSDAYIVFSIGSSGTIEIPSIDWDD